LAFPSRPSASLAVLLGFALVIGLAGCGSVPKGASGSKARACLARAMYFESNRSSAEGMLAVGTVVMNRVESGQYPSSVCGVVGQPKQFAPGVLSKPMTDSASRDLALQVADAVPRGKRHRGVGERAMFFHTAGYRFPYRNMHYVYVAGGNAFYEKRKGTNNDPRRQDALLAQALRREPAAHRRAATMIGGKRAVSSRSQLADARRIAPGARMDAVQRVAAAPRPAPVAAYQPEPPATSIEDLILADGF